MWLLALEMVACTPDGKPGRPRGPEPTDPPPTTVDTTTPPTTPPTPPPPTGDTGGGTTTSAPQSVLQFDGDPPTNLIVISLDTTRRDFIGRFSGTDHTPNLDAVLDEGVVLENHRSCSSWTAPSMTCVTTGLSPFELDWWPWTGDPYVAGYDDDLPTLAGQFQFQKAYRTTLVTANTVFDQDLNFTRGFERVVHPSWEPATQVANAGLAEAQSLVDDGDPFYLHVHFIDPHASYCPPDEYVDDNDYIDIYADLCYDFYYLAGYQYWYQDQYWRDVFKTDAMELYEAELTYWDAEFGRFWAELDAMGALDDALVVFVTDHGEQFFERGSYGHGNALGAEENRSTAAFWAKNLVPQVWTEPTVHQDLAATVQDYFGLVPETPSSGVVVGLAPADRYLRGMLYWGPGYARLSIVQGDKQLLYDFWGEKHFYDHAIDPTGLLDQYDPGDPDVIAMWGPMSDFVDDVITQWPSAGTPYYAGP